MGYGDMSYCTCDRCEADREKRQMPNKPLVDWQKFGQALRGEKPVFVITVEEARALYSELEKQYVNHENILAVKVVFSLQKFVEKYAVGEGGMGEEDATGS
jgi:hypothetical protein